MFENSSMPLAGKRVWVTGHRGLLGSALCRRLEPEDCQLITVTRQELDLKDQQATCEWMACQRPDIIIHCAALVGGIQANRTRPADFLMDNLQINLNVIQAAAYLGVDRLVVFGSSCFYPKQAPQPLTEDSLLTGPLEPTNEAYALAKIAGVKLCGSLKQQYGHDFISVVPTNLYGPGDNFSLEQGHVIASLIAKFVHAKQAGEQQVNLWGTGKPEREFLYVDDAADGIVYLLNHYHDANPINLSGGETVSISTLANMIAELVGFEGDIVFDTSKPDGMMKKSLDNRRIAALGWTPSTELKSGLGHTLASFLQGGCQ